MSNAISEKHRPEHNDDDNNDDFLIPLSLAGGAIFLTILGCCYYCHYFKDNVSTDINQALV